MNMRRICIAGVLAVIAGNAWAAGSAPSSAGKSKLDVNGTWNATVAGRGPPQNMVFVFKQEKDKVTGTMSTNGAPPVEIQDGKVYRTMIRFAVETTMPAMPAMPGAPPSPQGSAPRKVTTKYEATVDGDTMTIETVGGGGGMGGMGGMGGGMGGGGGMPMGGGGDMGGGGMGGMGGGMGGMRMGGMGKITATRQK